MLKKLRTRFVLINMSIITAMLLIIFGLVFQFTKTDLESQSTAMLQSLSQTGLQTTRPDRDVRLPYFTLQINIWGEVSVSGYTSYDLTDEAFIQELIQAVYTGEENTGSIEKYALRYQMIPGPGVQKIVFLDVSSQKNALTTLVEMLLLMGFLSLIVFWIISILLARWAVKPVDHAWQQQRQFVSDASHELKTPLTVIMSNAELLRQDGENSGQYTQNILVSTRQMRNLVEGLLELARVDNGQVKAAFEKLDLSKLINDVTLPFEPVCFEKGLTLQSGIEPNIYLNGSAQHLQQIATILLDNAVKYSAPGIVDLRLTRQGRGHCLLTVANPGEPIPKEELTKIFERFYRTDRARSNTGSFGLGLSIAKQITEEHKGQIWAESNASGNRFSVLLPCDPA